MCISRLHRVLQEALLNGLRGPLLGLLLIAAAWAWTGSPSDADVRETPPRRAFQSGGARSEIVLKEMLAVLQRIDQRLERLEKHVVSQAEPAH